MSNPTPSSPQAIAEHQLEWNDRLQDWLDGDIDGTDSAAVESHLADCGICQQQLAAFEALDKELFSAAPAPGLSAGFDQRLFAQIDAIDETQRVAARRRAEEELQENLRALSRGWRRTLAFIVPGVVGDAVSAWVAGRCRGAVVGLLVGAVSGWLPGRGSDAWTL